MKKVKVLVACGAGIATSTVAMKKITDLFSKSDLEVDITQIKIAEATNMQSKADMLISTSVLPTVYDIPAITAIAFISGIGEEQLNEKILATAREIANS